MLSRMAYSPPVHLPVGSRSITEAGVGKGRASVSHCGMHHEQVSVGTCRRCGAECCASCQVFSFGESKAPFCPPCALAVAGLDEVDRIDLARVERVAADPAGDAGLVLGTR